MSDCGCRTDHPFPLADCGCQICECFTAGLAPPLDLDIDWPLPDRTVPEPVDLDEEASS